MCNQTVKFGTFAERAFAEGADFVATGHYARRTTDASGATHLLRAADEHKDQTYFLWRVAADTFARTIFPVGDIASKAEVRRMCAERGLGVERKPDSDGICFIGPVGIPCSTRLTGAPETSSSGRPGASWAATTAPSSSPWDSARDSTSAEVPRATSSRRTSRRTWST